MSGGRKKQKKMFLGALQLQNIFFCLSGSRICEFKKKLKKSTIPDGVDQVGSRGRS